MIGHFITLKGEPITDIYYVLSQVESKHASDNSWGTTTRWLVTKTTLTGKKSPTDESIRLANYVRDPTLRLTPNQRILEDYATDQYKLVEWVEFGYIVK